MNSHRALERKVDKLWQIAIIRRARGRCEGHKCTGAATVGHHIVGRSCRVLRHDMNNGIAFCQKCHDWAHAHIGVFQKLLRRLYPERFAILSRKHELLTVPYLELLKQREKELKQCQ